MEKCLFVHPDNLERSRKELVLKVAVIARPDWFMKSKARHVIVETNLGVHTRCYVSTHNGVNFLIIYGRFDRVRSTSDRIDFAITQEVISAFQIPVVIGTFSVGSIHPDDKAGRVYIPDNLVGMGSFGSTRNAKGFRNVDMFQPFCVEARDMLVESAKGRKFPVQTSGTYVCFHGYPRIETKAELDFYHSMGWQIVGQTMDPEATLAREAGCHYAAITATIDDQHLRARFLAKDMTARQKISENIHIGRKRTFEIFLASLPRLAKVRARECSCLEQSAHVQKRSAFYYRPDYLMDF